MTSDLLLGQIGNTPLIELTRLSPKPGVRIFAKVEGFSPTGSIKDRLAVALVDDAERNGRIQPGGTLVEASSGNTAIALAMVARRRGYKLCVVLPDTVVPSIADTLQLFGAQVHWCKPDAGMRGAIETADEVSCRCSGTPMRQFQSPVNLQVHYEQTAPEILAQLPRVDVFVAGIGTGGTITGTGRRLREANPSVRLVGVEPQMGERLQGLKSVDDGYEPPLLDFSLLSRRLLIDAATSLQRMRQLAEIEGLVAGVSSGATLHAALLEAERMDEGNIVIMCSDSGWKYLPSRPWNAAAEHDPELDELHWW